MVDMDDLRRSLDEEEDFFDEDIDEVLEPPDVGGREDVPIFGLTAPQRMILSIFLFLDVAILGCMCLIALGRIPI